MADFFETLLGVVLGLGLIAGVFAFAFRRMPEAREAPHSSYDATSWSDPGPHDG